MSPLALRLQTYTKLSEDDRAQIEVLTRKGVREVPARRDLIREGDKPKSIFLVLEGWACRYKQLPDGRRQIVDFFLPGDICELNISLLHEMDHSVGAITPLKVAEVAREELDDLMQQRPRIAQAVHWNELVSVSIQREWTLNVGQRTAYERIAHLLSEIFVRLRAVGLTSDKACDFPLTQTDIAEATGLTAVHVNRTLQDLRKDGLIELQGRRLRIPDLKALLRAGLFNENYLHFGQLEAQDAAND